ncbi:chorismate-binding protein [Cellulomonas oligotrophica]|uniref:Anthranilate synthase n=1 Tax=Cellulomonas oligotrophica TaxID=931536 RepID=A0A7Y9FCB9_9CELL|nr:chorismate-binding protein [Cellulomonas oligotrophica]NYD84640.1 para-aminobenzoate synthetase component 1 [Cellulomonas oligotrophica]GIG31707.1 anthranilate synthase [Cellulomonas oligotrophica]
MPEPASAPRPRPGGPGAVAPGEAWFAGVHARGVVEHVDVRAHPDRLGPGWWALVGTFEGQVDAWRFADVRTAPDVPGPSAAGEWRGPAPEAWTTSLGEAAYVDAVHEVRASIRAGDVYQANLCRVLGAPLPGEPDARALGARLAHGNPAPYGGGVHVPTGGPVPACWVVTASPELFLRVQDGVVTSAPIKGTARTPDGLSAKDRAENVMITDLVRNDLQQVCRPGTVRVEHLLAVEQHPGLVHLVSTVAGDLLAPRRPGGAVLADLLDATYPPGSVSGAPKSSALRLLTALEPVPRGPYCGLVGWARVDEDGTLRAELAVAIRTFWWTDGVLRFGTGAGITWGSDAEQEWDETELKAARLVALASTGAPPPGVAG